ncbi:MAG: putative ABC transporter ATP-binding protein [Methanoregula sp. PtaU1.Bin051]|nr:MAG: putative ABC transporter ATP-binding protein [Methanoregula sp. PtaU1.Bin051]
MTERVSPVCYCPPPSAGERRELIHVDCASHIYPDGSIGIHQMCFRVLEGEIVALCGPNGSGKSTLIEHINGLLRPSEGKIVVNGCSVGSSQAADLWKEVGIVFQRSDDQLFAPTVLDDVMFGPLNLGMEEGQARTEALAALETVGAEGLDTRLPNYLSGGEKRLVAIAGILAMHPKIIAFDEPTSDLDPVHSAKIEEIVRKLRDVYGISIVLATHDLDLAARLADRVCLVRKGSICAEGSPADIFYNETLISNTGLLPPAVVRIYRSYCKSKGLTADKRPLDAAGLIEAISNS